VAISFHNALGTYEAALKLRTQRAEVLASNLANADTPNFKARDFDFQKALGSQMAMSKSASGQSPQWGMTEKAVAGAMQYRVPTQPSIDGRH